MGEFLSYSMTSGISLLLLYLGYRLFLARYNQPGFNRAIMLLIYFVSFVGMPILLAFVNSYVPYASQSNTLEMIGDIHITTIPHSKPLWGTMLIWVFISGMIIVAIKSVSTWIRLISIIQSGRKIRQDGYTLVVIDNEMIAPFSWIRYVVINNEEYEKGYPTILTHELKHITSRHWIDLMIAQIICIINWFNPAAWLIRKEMMLVHEYQADMAVIESGYPTQDYQMLLIKKAVGSRFPSLANSLNHSKLKKRITMMYKEKSGARRKFNAIALVPMLALALGAVKVPAVRAAVATISHSKLSANKNSENPDSDQIHVKVFKVTDLDNYGNATTIRIKGYGLGNHLTVSGGTFTTMGKTYQATALQCSMTDGTATITAKFPFTSEYDDSSMTLTIDGEEIPFNLEAFFDNAQVVAQSPEE